MVPLCFRKVEGGSTHVRPHCLTQLVRVPAIGTMTYIGGLPHILCPEPGCGAPAVVDPACVVTGRSILDHRAYKCGDCRGKAYERKQTGLRNCALCHTTLTYNNYN